MAPFNICAILLCFSVLAGSTFGSPLIEKRQTSTVGTGVVRSESLVPLDPSQPLSPEIVDLFDQYDNLQRQADSLAEGSPNRDSVVRVAAVAKQRLEINISGVASLTDGPVPTPTPALPRPGPAADPITVTVAPSPAGNGNGRAPVLTIVTQLGTSAIVVASQGTTSTVVLDPVSGRATRTAGTTVGETGRAAPNRSTSDASMSIRLPLSSVITSLAMLGLLVLL